MSESRGSDFVCISSPDLSKTGVLVQRVYKPLRCAEPFSASSPVGLRLGRVHVGFLRFAPVFPSVNFKTLLSNDETVVPLNPPPTFVKEPMGNYVVLEVAEYEDGEEVGAYERAAELLDLALPWLRLSISEVVAEHFVGETQFAISKGRAVPAIVGPHLKNPYGWEPVAVRSEQFAPTASAYDAFQTAATDDRDKVELAMLWYSRAMAEEVQEIQFIDFWLVLETLAMSNYRDDRGLRHFVESLLGSETYGAIEERVRRFRGIRGAITHGARIGYLRERRLTGELVLVQRLAEETLRHFAGLPSKGSVDELLAKERSRSSGATE